MGRFDRILPGLLLPELYTVPVLAAREYENDYLALTAPEGWHLEDLGEREDARVVLLTPLGKGSGLETRLESRALVGPSSERFLGATEASLLREVRHDPGVTVSRLSREVFSHRETPCAQLSMERSLNGVPVLVNMHLLFNAGWAHTVMRTTVCMGAEPDHIAAYINGLLPSLRFKAGPPPLDESGNG